MNYKLLGLMLLALLLIVYVLSPLTVYPNSSCATFAKVGEWLYAQDLDHIALETRGELCKVPIYMIGNPNKCPSADWRDLYNKLRCDSAAEGSGTLGTDGVVLRLA